MNTSNTCTKVTVRQAKLKNGMISLYLDFYPAVRMVFTSTLIQRIKRRMILIKTCS